MAQLQLLNFSMSRDRPLPYKAPQRLLRLLSCNHLFKDLSPQWGVVQRQPLGSEQPCSHKAGTGGCEPHGRMLGHMELVAQAPPAAVGC